MSVAVLAMFGARLILPQYFQGVLDEDAAGSGLRLLPMVGGLIAGALPANRVARAAGRGTAVAAGCAVLAAGVALGVGPGPATGPGFAAASAALAAVPEERAGVASAVLQACKNPGGPFGSAILGSVRNAAYRAGLPVAGGPPRPRPAGASSPPWRRRGASGLQPCGAGPTSPSWWDSTESSGPGPEWRPCSYPGGRAGGPGAPAVTRPAGEAAASPQFEDPMEQRRGARPGRAPARGAHLREGKKAKARAAIRRCALRLFQAQG